MSDHIELGRFSVEQLDRIIRESQGIRDAGERIGFLSELFLNVEYAEGTLVGDNDTREIFVINLDGVDCMTFIEYVEAMRLSNSYADFESNLKTVRYKSGIVDFYSRKHFFTDWKESNPELVEDATGSIGGVRTVLVLKKLNAKEDGTQLIAGIEPVVRDIAYIPSSSIDDDVFRELKTGDYIGIYSNSEGLDVSHVGIIIKRGDALLLRHASSQERYRRVVDQDLKTYTGNKPGIIVFRPRYLKTAG